jgi:hypothetical protein
MSWLTEVRQALKGLEVDSVEMSEAVVVKFEQAWLWLRIDRSTSLTARAHVFSTGELTVSEQAKVDTIWSRLDRRIWRAE